MMISAVVAIVVAAALLFVSSGSMPLPGFGTETPSETPGGESENPGEGNGGPITSGNCYVGGCSGEVCSDMPDVASNCIFKPEFACYRTAECTRKQNGQCGWTETLELKSCLLNPPAS